MASLIEFGEEMAPSAKLEKQLLTKSALELPRELSTLDLLPTLENTNYVLLPWISLALCSCEAGMRPQLHRAHTPIHCRQITATPHRSILHAAKSSQMPYMANIQKI